MGTQPRHLARTHSGCPSSSLSTLSLKRPGGGAHCDPVPTPLHHSCVKGEEGVGVWRPSSTDLLLGLGATVCVGDADGH